MLLTSLKYAMLFSPDQSHRFGQTRYCGPAFWPPTRLYTEICGNGPVWAAAQIGDISLRAKDASHNVKALVVRSVLLLGQVASKLRTQLSDAREAVHGKIVATDRLGLELQKEREELWRLRESSALQEAHHKRLQVGLTPFDTQGSVYGV
jgi:hypothetical protein